MFHIIFFSSSSSSFSPLSSSSSSFPSSSFRSLPGGEGSRGSFRFYDTGFPFSYLSLCSFSSLSSPSSFLLLSQQTTFRSSFQRLCKPFPRLYLGCVMRHVRPLCLLCPLLFMSFVSFTSVSLSRIWRPEAGGDYRKLGREGKGFESWSRC